MKLFTAGSKSHAWTVSRPRPPSRVKVTVCGGLKMAARRALISFCVRQLGFLNLPCAASRNRAQHHHSHSHYCSWHYHCCCYCKKKPQTESTLMYHLIFRQFYYPTCAILLEVLFQSQLPQHTAIILRSLSAKHLRKTVILVLTADS